MKLTQQQQKKMGCGLRLPSRCKDCLSSPEFRISVVGSSDFSCTYNYTLSSLPLCPNRPKTDLEIKLAIARAAVCEPCEHNKGVKLTILSGRGTEHIYRVACSLCSSCGGGLSLIKGKCKASKW